MSDDLPYRSPGSNIVVEQFPASFANGGLTVARLKTAAMLSVVYTVLTIPLAVLSFLHEVESDNVQYAVAYRVLLLLGTILWVCLMLLFKSFVNLRFEFHGMDRPLHFVVGLSVVTLIFAIFMGPLGNAAMEVKIANYVLLALYGVFSVWFGWHLCALPYYRGLRLFAWMTILIGAFTASLVLVLLVVPLTVAQGIAMAVVFSAAANELSLGRS